MSTSSPPQKDNGIAALKQLAEDSRSIPATCASTSGSRPTGRTISPWSRPGPSAAPSTCIRCSKETREFRAKLAPMTGALYDERLYKALK